MKRQRADVKSPRHPSPHPFLAFTGPFPQRGGMNVFTDYVSLLATSSPGKIPTFGTPCRPRRREPSSFQFELFILGKKKPVPIITAAVATRWPKPARGYWTSIWGFGIITRRSARGEVRGYVISGPSCGPFPPPKSLTRGNSPRWGEGARPSDPNFYRLQPGPPAHALGER